MGEGVVIVQAWITIPSPSHTHTLYSVRGVYYSTVGSAPLMVDKDWTIISFLNVYRYALGVVYLFILCCWAGDSYPGLDNYHPSPIFSHMGELYKIVISGKLK